MLVDLVIDNAEIRTMSSRRPKARSLAVLHGRVVAVDDTAGLHAREHVDLAGRTVLPGFNDAHAHSVWFGMTLHEVDLSSVTSVDDVYPAIQRRARELSADAWIVAAGYNPVRLGGRLPDRDRLDHVSGGRPVWIKHASGHSCQLSTAGLARTRAEAVLDGEMEGGRVVVGDDGRPTGVLEERAMSLVQDVVLPYSMASIERALDSATAQYAREGLTSVTDAGVAGGWIGHAPGELAAYQNARDRGVLRTRIQVMPVIDVLQPVVGHDDEPARRGLSGGIRTGWGDDFLQLGPVKVFTDGSILGRTAHVTEPYDGCPGNHGYLQEDADTMRDRVLDAAAGGWSLALHAVGDAALDVALDIIEEAARRHGRPAVPHRVEHGIVVRPDQLSRLSELQVACTVQPGFIPAFGEGLRRAIGERRSGWSIRARSMLDSGLPLAYTSDRPVAPGAPLAGVQAFVERLTDESQIYAPEERLSVEEALFAATVGSSAVTGQSARKGTLDLGQLADFVVLDADPTSVPVSQIGAIPVHATAVGGTFTHGPHA